MFYKPDAAWLKPSALKLNGVKGMPGLKETKG